MTRLAAALILQRRARIGVYRLIVGLLDAGMPIEQALAVAAETARGQGQKPRAWLLEKWRTALKRNRFSAGLADTLPRSEAMIFFAYGRVDARALFAAAARVADLRNRQIAALWKALAIPCLLAFGLVVLLFFAGGHLVPALQTAAPLESWAPLARTFGEVSIWLYGNAVLFAVVLAAAGFLFAAVVVGWTGPGRVFLDRLPPFSLYRMLVGSAFLFAALEFVKAGVDLNDRTFDEMRRASSRYGAHRIGAIQRRMSRRASLGRACATAGHRFPDPSLVPVISALDRHANWVTQVSDFVDRWIEESDETMRARAAALRSVLMVLAAAVLGSAINALFSIVQTAGRTASPF